MLNIDIPCSNGKLLSTYRNQKKGEEMELKKTVDRRNFITTAVVAGAGVTIAALPGEGHAQSSGAGGSASKLVRPGRRKLGKLEVSAVGMGVQNMHRTFQTTVPYRPEMINIIRAAFDRGITFFDCAEVYGPHENERILGEAAAPFRNQVVITSKFGFNVDLETGKFTPGVISRPDRIKRAVEGSLKRLRTDRIDLLYQHRVDPTVPIEDVAGAVKELMDQGKVLHWGLSEMGLQTLRRAHAALPVTAVQNEYSMLWRGPEKDVIATCEELGIGFVPWSPLGYGFLAGAIDAETTFAPGDFRAGTTRMSPENLPQNLSLVELIKTWAKRKQATPAQVALAWLIAQKPWIVPIPGSTVMAHMVENSAADSIKFTPTEITELNSAVRAIEIKGKRLPDVIQAWSDVEAPPKK